MPLRIVLVCGGRYYGNRLKLFQTLDSLHEVEQIDCIIHGAARGADTMAEDWAKARGVYVKSIRADWKKHHRAAGPIRNQRMMDEGRPTLVVAFPGNTGTADMVGRARKANVEVIEVI